MRRDLPHDFLFYCETLEADSARAELVGPEHHHLSRVLRMQTGATVHVSNGRGLVARCVIADVARASTGLSVAEVVRTEGEAVLTLALACLKKDAFELAVRQCTELGVTHFQPFTSANSHLPGYTSAFVERLRRVALAAMKQSFRGTLPRVAPAISFDALLELCGKHDDAVVGDAAAPPFSRPAAAGSRLVIVGPEAGFTGEELERLAALGCRLGAVSANRLRAETAAAAVVAVLQGPGA